MRLHVLGPAFGLPSIDAQCIAAVALVKRRVKEGEWSLIPTHEQERQLPYLEDGDQYIEGFSSIARYLDGQSMQRPPEQHLQPQLDEAYGTDSNRLSTYITTHAQTRMSFYLDDEEEATDLDSNQTETNRANSTALSSFIASNAQTLLDISLYVSADNYSRTRSAFTRILPWHANYIVPPARRKAARLRTHNLGISSIDVDDIHDDLSSKPPGLANDVGKEAKEFEPETHKRASLLLGGRETVASLLRRPEHSAVFKLHAVAENFFGPLEAMIGEKRWLLGNEGPTTVDCLAYGYLSLMQFPDMPQDWLAKVLARKHPRLGEYLERLHFELDVATEAEDVVALGKCKSEDEVRDLRKVCAMGLPWEPPAQSNALEISRTIVTDILSRVPLLYSPTTIVPSNAAARQASPWLRYLPLALTLTATSLGLSLHYAFSTGLLIWPHGQEVHIFGKKRFSDFGHLGAALAGVSLLGQQAQVDRALRQGQEREKLGSVEVEVERDGT